MSTQRLGTGASDFSTKTAIERYRKHGEDSPTSPTPRMSTGIIISSSPTWWVAHAVHRLSVCDVINAGLLWQCELVHQILSDILTLP